MSGEQKKFKVDHAQYSSKNPTKNLDDLIQKEYLNGYEPLSICLDCNSSFQFIVVFKKIDAKKKSKSRYDNVMRLMKK